MSREGFLDKIPVVNLFFLVLFGIALWSAIWFLGKFLLRLVSAAQ